jgi:hypothetical protein
VKYKLAEPIKHDSPRAQNSSSTRRLVTTVSAIRGRVADFPRRCIVFTAPVTRVSTFVAELATASIASITSSRLLPIQEECPMRAAITFVAVTVAVCSASIARAQVSKTMTGESKVVTATIEAIEHATRKVTLKNADGTYEVLDVPASVKRFDALKVGDTIKARTYENVVFRLKDPSEKNVDTTTASTTPAAGGAKAGTVAGQRTITATITAIDPAVPSISFTGPNGWAYSTRVEDKEALSKVKVGDRVDITWTDATLLSVE